MSGATRLLNDSSVAPSANTITFPGWPLAWVSRYMPFTKAIITVKSEITSTKASAVISVVRQRTVRLRTRYRKGTFTPKRSPATRTSAAAPAIQTATEESAAASRVDCAIVHHATFEKASVTRIELAVNAGTTLPARAVDTPIPSPHQIA